MWSKGDLLAENEYRFMIFCHGLPSHPYQHNPAKVEKWIEEGFVLLYPNYEGTWASDGRMSWEGCVDTILKAIDFLKGGVGRNVYDDKKIMWKVEDITLVGGSFGGAVALVAGAKSRDVKAIISVAAPTDWRNHSRIPGEYAEPIQKLYKVVMKGWKNLWRIPGKEEWERLVKGTVDLNAVDYVDALKNKNVMLIHGERDCTVSPERSINLYNMLKEGSGKHNLIVLKEEDQIGNDIIGRKDMFLQIFEWLRK